MNLPLVIFLLFLLFVIFVLMLCGGLYLYQNNLQNQSTQQLININGEWTKETSLGDKMLYVENWFIEDNSGNTIYHYNTNTPKDRIPFNVTERSSDRLVARFSSIRKFPPSTAPYSLKQEEGFLEITATSSTHATLKTHVFQELVDGTKKNETLPYTVKLTKKA